MDEKEIAIASSDLECCPKLIRRPLCDSLHFRYRFPFAGRSNSNRKLNVQVSVILHFLLERCSGPLVLGDPIYSTTLLPGEQVRLFTSDRHSRWSYDSESSLSYRHETTSEESFLTAGMAQAMSDLTINESGASISSFEESWAEGGGGISFSFLGLEIGGGGGGGSYDAQSLQAFTHSLSRHAECASRYVAAGVRSRSSTSIGEVERRSHAESESEAHYESSSRMFRNDNKCHAVTYLFYKINKLQIIKFNLVAIERRIEDPDVPTGAYQRIPIDTTGRVSVLPKSISATDKNRLEIERMARTSAAERLKATSVAVNPSYVGAYAGGIRFATKAGISAGSSLSSDDRENIISGVDKELADKGILDLKNNRPSDDIIKVISWKREELLPTPGILVKGCLDKCNTCEPALQKEIELNLERKKLENEMLKRQIELLEKSQEYRCCPEGSEETEKE